MALRSNKGRKKVLVAESLHPHYRAVIDQYLTVAEVITVPMKEGKIHLEEVKALLDSTTAAILLPYPSFFGGIDAVADCFSAAQEAGAITIACANPLAWALYQSAAEIGADIAVGDLQPLGLPLSFGGPYVGYMACKQKFVRQLPGRLVGETTDSTGKRGFVLTLQAREQHIRREKATSNICSNQNLAAIASLVTMLWYGPQGLRKLALTNYQRTAYLKEKLCALPGVEALNDSPHLNEFAVRLPVPVKKVVDHLETKGILAGLPLGSFFSQHADCLLVAVTETKTLEQLNLYVASVKEVL
jgi:glycine dehydrogenase subunit 1